MVDERGLLREYFERILRRDKDVSGQLGRLRRLANLPELRPTLESVQERVGALETVGPDSQLALETIVLRIGRPVLEVANDDCVVEGPEAEIWEARLGNATVRAALRRVIPSVGRIEVEGHPRFTWVGTGWLIADDVVVTNRHVASEFASVSLMAGGRAFVFRRGGPGLNTRMSVRVDFRRELRNNAPRAFVVKDVLHIEDDDGPDFAFLRVEAIGAAGRLSPALQPGRAAASESAYVATVGYPASDSRIPDHQLMSRLFGDKYNVKRLAPGQVQRVSDELVFHDCTTLGGNSGSPIVDLASGDVLGLHFSGVFERENQGVLIGYVTSRLGKVLHPMSPVPRNETKTRKPGDPSDTGASATSSAMTPASPDPVSVANASARTSATGVTISWTIPLQVSVTMGTATMITAGTGGAGVATATSGGSPAAGSAGRLLGGGLSTGAGAGGGGGEGDPTTPPAPDNITAAVADMRARLTGRDDVLTVRVGYLFRDGWITHDRAVVVVMRDRSATAEELELPLQVLGFPVDVRLADAWDVAESLGKLETLEGLPHTTYKKPADFALEQVEERMSVTCHVSPDAGWPILRDFLAGTKQGLTVGMYDFTAPHIIDGVLDAVQDARRQLTLVMQEGEALGGKPDDIAEEETIHRYKRVLGDRFEYAPASVGRDRQFASAYHIKVTVRDGKSFWLSSGNWQSSNQPNQDVAVGKTSWDLLLRHNREWHVVVDSPTLAKQFEKYLQYDLANAKRDACMEAVPLDEIFFLVDEAVEERVPPGRPTYFAPFVINRMVKVRPLLTPDNYQEHVLELIRSGERRILFQNQSLSLLGTDNNGDDKNDARFAALVDALLEKQQQGVDVRIIMRGEFAPVKPLEELQKRGFDMSKVRLQNRCHTKGIIVDGTRIAVGSHNWTNQGTLVNRDASLIFDDEEIAFYFEAIFWFDWNNLSRQSVGTRRVVLTSGRRRHGADGEAPTPLPAGTRLVSWQEIVNGD